MSSWNARPGGESRISRTEPDPHGRHAPEPASRAAAGSVTIAVDIAEGGGGRASSSSWARSKRLEERRDSFRCPWAGDKEAPGPRPSRRASVRSRVSEFGGSTGYAFSFAEDGQYAAEGTASRLERQQWRGSSNGTPQGTATRAAPAGTEHCGSRGSESALPKVEVRMAEIRATAYYKPLGGSDSPEEFGVELPDHETVRYQTTRVWSMTIRAACSDRAAPRVKPRHLQGPVAAGL